MALRVHHYPIMEDTLPAGSAAINHDLPTPFPFTHSKNPNIQLFFCSLLVEYQLKPDSIHPDIKLEVQIPLLSQRIYKKLSHLFIMFEPIYEASYILNVHHLGDDEIMKR